jgi:hypothetical protein
MTGHEEARRMIESGYIRQILEKAYLTPDQVNEVMKIALKGCRGKKGVE